LAAEATTAPVPLTVNGELNGNEPVKKRYPEETLNCTLTRLFKGTVTFADAPAITMYPTDVTAIDAAVLMEALPPVNERVELAITMPPLATLKTAPPERIRLEATTTVEVPEIENWPDTVREAPTLKLPPLIANEPNAKGAAPARVRDPAASSTEEKTEAGDGATVNVTFAPENESNEGDPDTAAEVLIKNEPAVNTTLALLSARPPPDEPSTPPLFKFKTDAVPITNVPLPDRANALDSDIEAPENTNDPEPDTLRGDASVLDEAERANDPLLIDNGTLEVSAIDVEILMEAPAIDTEPEVPEMIELN